MKTALATLLFLLAATLAWADEPKQEKKPEPQRQPPRTLTAEQVKEMYGDKVDLHLDQPYAGNKNPKQCVDLYLPKMRANDKPLPVLVFIHGGGWVNGDRKSYARQAASFIQEGKYAVVAVGYRLSAEAQWPQQIYDCKAAIRWVRGHAKEYNLNADKLAVIGNSAGGHLVSLLGTSGGVAALEGDLGEFTSQSSRVTCVVNYYGPSDFAMPLFTGEKAGDDDSAVNGLLGGKLKEKQAEAKAASPVTYIDSTDPPVLTVHGTKDSRVDYKHAERLNAALKQAGVTSLLLPITGGGHGATGGDEGLQRVKQFLDMQLLGVPAEISEKAIPGASPTKS